VAGLAAAQDLARAGRDVLVLEARDRVGGRIHTLHGQGWPVPVELGAEFAHGDAEATMRIASAASLPAVELLDRHAWVQDGRWQAMSGFWEEFVALSRTIRPTRRDRSFAAFLAARRVRPGRVETHARMLVEGYHAAPADDMSARAIAQAAQGRQGSNRQRRFPQGYDRVVDALRAGIDPDHAAVCLSTPVTRIEWRRGEVRVHAATALGTARPPIVARRAIVTLPLGVLHAPVGAAGAVAFDPPLRAKRRALAHLGVARVHKVALRFHRAFWEDLDFQRARTGEDDPVTFDFLHAPAAPFPTWWTGAPVGAPILTGWVGGPGAASLQGRAPHAMLEAALDALASVTRCSRRWLAARVEGWAWHDWQSDPYARGAYSYPRVGGAAAAKALARPLAGTLYFAGEATEAEESGTVSGAIASGRRAARAIIGG
jgi:monoamine oxidase